jgi:hypothetical protein
MRECNDYKRYGAYFCMENSNKEVSNVIDKVSEKVEEGALQLPEIVKEVIDKLTGKNMQVTYDFQNLEIDVPRISGPEGKELGSAKWKLNGKFVLSTAVLEADSSESNDQFK